MARPITEDAAIEIVTARDASSEVLELIRHDTAHALAEAAEELYLGVQVITGPAIEDGFTYDFARDEPFTPSDLEAMEERMREIVARNEPIAREVWDRGEAVRYFQSIGEEYKPEIIRDLPADEEITIYRQGGFVDLCRGPYLASTGALGTVFKLTRNAGAYWPGGFPESDAPARLWHRLALQEGTRRRPRPPQGGGPPGPPALRPRDGALPLPSGGSRFRLLAPGRRQALPPRTQRGHLLRQSRNSDCRDLASPCHQG